MTAMHQIDWSVYLVTDNRLPGERPLEEVVRASIRGGAGVVQYRDKHSSTRVLVERAALLRAICREAGACFLINDRIDVALAVDADGVHLGQDDMPLRLARKILGPNRCIGVTVHNLEELKRAEADGADYLSAAPVFATATKPDHQQPLGFEGVKRLALAARKPLVAIGGIDLTNAAGVISSGARGVCVVSAVMAAVDPEQATRRLHAAVREKLAAR